MEAEQVEAQGSQAAEVCPVSRAPVRQAGVEEEEEGVLSPPR